MICRLRITFNYLVVKSPSDFSKRELTSPVPVLLTPVLTLLMSILGVSILSIFCTYLIKCLIVFLFCLCRIHVKCVTFLNKYMLRPRSWLLFFTKYIFEFTSFWNRQQQIQNLVQNKTTVVRVSSYGNTTWCWQDS